MEKIFSDEYELFENSLLGLERWVEEHDYSGYEPFDGLSSVFRPLTFGSVFLDRIFMQVVRQSPLNLRPILGIKPLPSTKGRGYIAWGYLTRYRSTGKEEYLSKAESCLAWLKENRSGKFTEYSWANFFPFAGRGGRYEKDESIIVWTSLIGQTFMEAYHQLGDERYLEVAESACRWILSLPREKTDRGTCISYMMIKQSSIHNSNMLGAAILAKTAAVNGNSEYLDLAREAMLYSCERQREDGSWWYGEESKHHWVDNFHTGYNLDSLKTYIADSGDRTWERNLSEGFSYFKRTFFEESGRPKYYHNRAYPIDIQCASQAITTLAHFEDTDGESLELARKVAAWTIENMQRKDGAFIYRIYPWGKMRTPMLHWGQATMYKALALLLSKMETRGKSGCA